MMRFIKQNKKYNLISPRKATLLRFHLKLFTLEIKMKATSKIKKQCEILTQLAEGK